MRAPFRIRIDPFILLLLGALLLALVLPVRGATAAVFDRLADIGIFLLFFLHGAKLSRAAIISGIGAWRLHLMVLATTFGLFPLLALGLLAAIPTHWLHGGLGAGLLFLSVLPSTVQSSIAMTSIAGGNVPAAVTSASLSNVIGVVLTPALSGIMLGGAAGQGNIGAAMLTVAGTLLLPFALGHLARPLIGATIDRRKALVMRFDRGVIVLIVFIAFSAATVNGLWRQLDLRDLLIVAAADAVLLACVLAATILAARWARLSQADAAVLIFCGSKKSLVTGAPMAGALFPAAQVGALIVPLMLFHQLQLIVCAAIAQRFARRDPEAASAL